MSASWLARLANEWFVACPSRALRRKPLPRTVCGTPLALVRLDGLAVAFVDRCPHRNLPLSMGRVCDAALRCAYHGWTFDAQGTCRAIPGLAGVSERPGRRATRIAVAERDGFVWVNVGADVATPPPLPVQRYPAFADPRFDSFVWVTAADCALIDGLENLLDATHPHFVHAGLVRTAKRRPVTVTVRATDEMAEAVYAETGPPRGLIPRLFEGDRATSVGRYFPPGVAQLEYGGKEGPRFLLTAMYAPLDERRVAVHAVLSTPRGRVPAALKAALLRVVFRGVLAQDRGVLRAQRRNLERFGGAHYASTPLDVMRAHLVRALSSDVPAASPPAGGTIDMQL
jgi:phenylpropionate dioxygenase-like ring-hydroxylating dioxygenase large terminal subunit